MGTFIQDGAGVLPPVKANATTPTGASTEWAAEDANLDRSALLDLRSEAIREKAAREAADAAILAGAVQPLTAVGPAGVISTGSTAVRTVADRFAGPRINVLDFGAVGDTQYTFDWGTGLPVWTVGTPCTAAFQAAIDKAAAAGGGTVVVPVGRYWVESLVLKQNVRLVGEGYPNDHAAGACLYSEQANGAIVWLGDPNLKQALSGFEIGFLNFIAKNQGVAAIKSQLHGTNSGNPGNVGWSYFHDLIIATSHGYIGQSYHQACTWERITSVGAIDQLFFCRGNWNRVRHLDKEAGYECPIVPVGPQGRTGHTGNSLEPYVRVERTWHDSVGGYLLADDWIFDHVLIEQVVCTYKNYIEFYGVQYSEFNQTWFEGIPVTTNYVGDGMTQDYIFEQRTDASYHVVVRIEGRTNGPPNDPTRQTEGVDYTMVVNADQVANPGGSVHFMTAPEDNKALVFSGGAVLWPIWIEGCSMIRLGGRQIIETGSKLKVIGTDRVLMDEWDANGEGESIYYLIDIDTFSTIHIENPRSRSLDNFVLPANSIHVTMGDAWVTTNPRPLLATKLPQDGGDNLIINPSFEQGQFGWRATDWNSWNGPLVTAPSEVALGLMAVLQESQVVTQVVAIPASMIGREMVIGCKIKIASGSGTGRGIVYPTVEDSIGELVGHGHSNSFNFDVTDFDGQWFELRCGFKVRAAGNMRIGVGGWASGATAHYTYYVDDVYVCSGPRASNVRSKVGSLDIQAVNGPYSYGDFHAGIVSICASTSKPAVGVWKLGDVCLNANPSAIGVRGWRCIQAGEFDGTGPATDPVFEVIPGQAAARADVAGGVTLPDLATAFNDLLAKLRAAGTIAT